ncbi:unnamed protein product, partial [marine sediment metagenome]
LLGFDMKYENGQPKARTHWHEGHPVAHRPNTVQGFIKYFQLAATRTKEIGLQVINLNPDSALPYFPKRPFSEVLH